MISLLELCWNQPYFQPLQSVYWFLNVLSLATEKCPLGFGKRPALELAGCGTPCDGHSPTLDCNCAILIGLQLCYFEHRLQFGKSAPALPAKCSMVGSVGNRWRDLLDSWVDVAAPVSRAHICTRWRYIYLPPVPFTTLLKNFPPTDAPSCVCVPSRPNRGQMRVAQTPRKF